MSSYNITGLNGRGYSPDELDDGYQIISDSDNPDHDELLSDLEDVYGEPDDVSGYSSWVAAHLILSGVDADATIQAVRLLSQDERHAKHLIIELIEAIDLVALEVDLDKAEKAYIEANPVQEQLEAWEAKEESRKALAAATAGLRVSPAEAFVAARDALFAA